MQTDVLIAGGGLAGLALADRLEQAGIDYRLVEARRRFGGRVLSAQAGSTGFDLGPAWFWPEQPRMAKLARRLNLTVFEQYAEGDIVSEDPHGHTTRGMGWAPMQESYRIDGGISRMTDGLAAGLPNGRAQTSARLASLAWNGASIEAGLDGEDGTAPITAGHVVLALPPRVAAETIAFSPALPDDALDAMRQIPTWMAGHAKIIALYDRPFWRQAGLSGDAMSRKGPMVEIHDASPAEGGPYALFGFVGFPAGVRAAHQDEMLIMARDQLTRLFGADAASPKEIVLQDWAQDPLTATLADHTPGGLHPVYGRPRALADLWDGHLIMGSTEVAAQFGGFLEGALAAADDVFALLQKSGVAEMAGPSV